MMADLKDPRLIYAKGLLFLLVGVLAAGLVVAERPTLRAALLLAVAIWGFCRAYYFAFYVIQHYVDPGYRFAGLADFGRYLLRRRAGRRAEADVRPSRCGPDEADSGTSRGGRQAST